MAYTPTEWVSGTIISASKLNNIERGVESVNSEYTPTTWAEGDTVTAAKLNKIEQGIAAASGGGGDFLTATVTIHTSINDLYFTLYGALADISYELSYPTSLTTVTKLDIPAVDGASYEVVLYKGVTYLAVYDRLPTVSGDASVETFGEGNLVTITGDCTITFAL